MWIYVYVMSCIFFHCTFSLSLSLVFCCRLSRASLRAPQTNFYNPSQAISHVYAWGWCGPKIELLTMRIEPETWEWSKHLNPWHIFELPHQFSECGPKGMWLRWNWFIGSIILWWSYSMTTSFYVRCYHHIYELVVECVPFDVSPVSR